MAAEQPRHQGERERQIHDQRHLGSERIDAQQVDEGRARHLLRHHHAVRKLVGVEHGELELRAELGRHAARRRLAEVLVRDLDAANLLAVELRRPPEVDLAYAWVSGGSHPFSLVGS